MPFLRVLIFKYSSFILYALKKVPPHIVPVKDKFERNCKKTRKAFIYMCLNSEKKQFLWRFCLTAWV